MVENNYLYIGLAYSMIGHAVLLTFICTAKQ
jgi:hypothetical protein